MAALAKYRFFRLGLLVLALAGPCRMLAQITPPGITSGANTSGWAAAGVNQEFLRRWATNAYIGQSWQSQPDNRNPLYKPAIFILNQETYYSFTDNWQLAFCNSYRKQREFLEEAPFAPDDPAFRREIRYYTRLFYRHKEGRLGFAHSFRQEFRTFYRPDWSPWSSPYQIRLRAKTQFSVPLNPKGTLSWLLANDVLAATSYERARRPGETSRWTRFQFTENRFSTFLRIEVENPNLYLDPGLMYQIWLDGDRDLRHTFYPSIDLILVNPFRSWTREKLPPSGEGD